MAWNAVFPDTHKELAVFGKTVDSIGFLLRQRLAVFDGVVWPLAVYGAR